MRLRDIYVLSHFEDVRTALQASDTLICGEGVGLSDIFNNPGAPNLLRPDGDQHRRMRFKVIRPCCRPS